MTFADFSLDADILKSVLEAGYTTPTPIQQEAIPLILEGRDLFGCAQTGTGKTASYMLPLLSKLQSGRVRARMPRALVLTPTRELALQVQEGAARYGKYTKFGVVTLIGGESMVLQEKELKKRVDILIATPGRLLDLLERGSIMLGALEFLVIDEADRLLDMGFIPDVEKIVAKTPQARQTLLFSATVSPAVRKLADRFLTDPAQVTVTPKEVSAQTIEQSVVMVSARGKQKALRHYLEQEKPSAAIIFCNRKTEVSRLSADLIKRGYSASPIHGDLTQSQRRETLDAFKEGKVTLLVASDVAARGIDVADLPFVFNIGLPINPEEYVHRIGRTGRAGRSGRAVSFVEPSEEKLLKALEKLLGKELDRVTFEDGDAKEEAAPAPKKQRTSKRAAPKAAAPAAQEAALEPIQEAPAAPPAPKQPRTRSKATPSARHAPKAPVMGFGDSVPAFFSIAFTDVGQATPTKGDEAS